MSDELSTGMPTTGAALGAELTGALLRGWGAQPVDVATARRLADELAAAVPPGSAAATIVPDQALAQQPVDPRRPKANSRVAGTSTQSTVAISETPTFCSSPRILSVMNPTTAGPPAIATRPVLNT